MYSKIQVYNLALAHLGDSTTIQSESQGGAKINILNKFYDSAVGQTLKDFDWNFARAYRQLPPTLSGKSLNPDYEYEYDYPNDCLAARAIHPFKEDISFEIATNANGEKVINANVTTPLLKYTRRVKDETKFTEEFTLPLSLFLAWLSCPGITGGTKKQASIMRSYEYLIDNGLASNASEGSDKDDSVADWHEARN